MEKKPEYNKQDLEVFFTELPKKVAGLINKIRSLMKENLEYNDQELEIFFTKLEKKVNKLVRRIQNLIKSKILNVDEIKIFKIQ